MNSKPCDWCCGGSQLDVAPGYFRDFDSDLSYGFPVCGGCGGLGLQVDSDDFEKRRKKIMTLRFEYCPTELIRKGRELSIVTKLDKLKQLDKEINELFKLYGDETKNSLARLVVVEGLLKGRIGELETSKSKVIEICKSSQLSITDPERKTCLEALVCILERGIDEGEGIFREGLEKYPNSSFLHHDYGIFLDNFRLAPYEEILKYLEKAITLEPKDPAHYKDLAQCLIYLGRKMEALPILGEAIRIFRDDKKWEKTMQQARDLMLECLVDSSVFPDLS